MKQESNCIICRKPLSGRQDKFCSEKCKNHYFQSYKAQKARGLARKAELVNALGGQCSLCGYTDNINALSFRHKTTGVHAFDTRSLANKDFEKVKVAAKDFTLVCKNCDTEMDRPIIEKPKKSSQATPVLDLKSLKAGQTIVLGISGGVDSVVMLDLFVKAKQKLNLVVAHLNHGVRPEAKEDEKFVQNLAVKYSLAFESKTIRKPAKGNLEEELRDKRREYLLAVAKEHKADYVALAHNANDQAETVLYNLLRGSGPAGLSGMDKCEGKIIRPLLSVSREEIEIYALDNKLEWHEDVTNKDVSYTRNYLRHRVLPTFGRINPEWLENINRAAKIQKNIENYLRSEAEKLIGLNTNEVLKLDEALRFELYALLFEKAKGDRRNLSYKNLLEIDELVKSDQGTKSIDLPNGIVAIRSYSSLDFRAKKEHNIHSLNKKPLAIGKTIFGEWEISVEKTKKNEKNSDNSIYINQADLRKVLVRTYQNGDKIAKIGLHGRKKLQDLFTDDKIDRVKRHEWPVITLKNEIIWIPTLARSESTEKFTKRDIKLTARKAENEKK